MGEFVCFRRAPSSTSAQRLDLFFQSELFFFEGGDLKGIGGGVLELFFDLVVELFMPSVKLTDTRFGGHSCLPCYVNLRIEPPRWAGDQLTIVTPGQETKMTDNGRLIVGISGASGVIYGVRALQVLREIGIESHLVATKAAEMTLAYETELRPGDLPGLADHAYKLPDVGAPIASGSFQTLGMLIAPCSVRTMSEIATGVTSSLLTRAADVVLKERRRLVLMVRETPFHLGHLRTMTQLTEMGAIVMPPLPAFYARPRTLSDIVDQSVARALDLFDLNWSGAKRWGEDLEQGRRPAAAQARAG